MLKLLCARRVSGRRSREPRDKRNELKMLKLLCARRVSSMRSREPR